MERNYTANGQNGWDSSSHDYHTHLSKMERLVSIHPDVPHYPNVHLIFNRKAMKEEENRSQQTQSPKLPEPEIIKKIKGPEARKKVLFVENKEPGEVDKGKVQYVETKETGECVDEDADGFIQQRRKNFELCKWATFKA